MSLVPLLASSGLTYLAFRLQSNSGELAWPELAWIYTLASITMAFAFTPTTFIALLSGFFIGLTSIPWVIISYQMASFIGYSLAKKIDQGAFVESTQLYPKVHAILGQINFSPLTLVFLARISPVLPFAIMNVVLSMAKVKLRHFLWGGLWGMLPRTLLFLWVGTQAPFLIELLQNRAENQTLIIGTLVLIVISVLGLYLYFVRLLKNVSKASPQV